MDNLHKVVRNTRTKKQIIVAKPTLKEIEVFNRSVLVSETDIEGIIVYVNRRYQGLTGYSEKDLIGSPHHLLRHPDMPRGVFKAMWKIISAGKIWRGYIKHLAKDGSFFWTLSYVQSKVDKKGNIIGYIGTGKIAYENPRKEVEEIYKSLRGREYIDHKYFMVSHDYCDTIQYKSKAIE